MRGLGDPKEGREAARAGNLAQFKHVFSRHMKSKRAQADLRSAIRYVAEGGACLMCYERDHTTCHRTIVAKSISRMVDAEGHHLGVKHGLVDISRPAVISAPLQKRGRDRVLILVKALRMLASGMARLSAAPV